MTQRLKFKLTNKDANASLLRRQVAAILRSPRELPVELYSFDDEYVQRLRSGDAETESHFIAYFRQLLRIKLRARYLAPDVVEDLTQDTFARVFRKLREENGIRQPDRIGAFVNSVCNYALQEHYREQGKNRQGEQENTDPPDKIMNLEKLAIAEEVNERVRKAVNSLAPKERELVSNIFFQEMEKDEVCVRMGVSRDYLRVLLHRAIEHIREALENKGLQPRECEAGKKKR